MKKVFGLLLIAAIFSGCDNESGSGNIVTEKRTTAMFTKIDVSAGIHVELRNGASEVRVEADDNILRYVKTSVENGILKIGLKDNANFEDTHIKVFVSAPEINGIKASSGSEVDAKDPIKASGTISFDASSAAEINASVDAPGIDVEASSGSEVSISGRTKDFKATSSSGSSVKAFELLTENLVADASSGANVNAHASVSVDAHASSGGDINYRGAAAIVKKQESSGGSVSKED